MGVWGIPSPLFPSSSWLVCGKFAEGWIQFVTAMVAYSLLRTVEPAEGTRYHEHRETPPPTSLPLWPQRISGAEVREKFRSQNILFTITGGGGWMLVQVALQEAFRGNEFYYVTSVSRLSYTVWSDWITLVDFASWIRRRVRRGAVCRSTLHFFFLVFSFEYHFVPRIIWRINQNIR